MDLIATQTLARSLMAEHLDTSWTFAWSRSRTVLGDTTYSIRRIRLSAVWVQVRTEDEVRDTILHEIAHALAGANAHHGPDWQRQARALGANPRPKSRSAEQIEPAYFAVHYCGAKVKRQGLPVKVRHCGPCHRAGLPWEDTQLTWVSVKTGQEYLARGRAA